MARRTSLPPGSPARASRAKNRSVRKTSPGKHTGSQHSFWRWAVYLLPVLVLAPAVLLFRAVGVTSPAATQADRPANLTSSDIVPPPAAVPTPDEPIQALPPVASPEIKAEPMVDHAEQPPQEQHPEQPEEQKPQDADRLSNIHPRFQPDESLTSHSELMAIAMGPDWESARNITLVYTWANGSDTTRLPLRRAAHASLAGMSLDDLEEQVTLDANLQRDRDNGELKWSIRSLERFLPWWAGELVIVSPLGVAPEWLDLEGARGRNRPVRVVAQEDIMPKDVGPTWNTNAIEPYLGRTPGLGDIFVHMNDDYFFASDFWPWVSFCLPTVPVQALLVTPYIFQDLLTLTGHPLLNFEPNPLHGGTAEHEEIVATRPELTWFSAVFKTNGLVQSHLPGVPWLHYIRHAPVVYHKSALEALLSHPVFGPEIEATSRRPFRHALDVVTPYMHHAICLSSESTYKFPVGFVEIGRRDEDESAVTGNSASRYRVIQVKDDLNATVDEVLNVLFSEDLMDDDQQGEKLGEGKVAMEEAVAAETKLEESTSKEATEQTIADAKEEKIEQTTAEDTTAQPKESKPMPLKLFVLNDDFGEDNGHREFIHDVLSAYYGGDWKSSYEFGYNEHVATEEVEAADVADAAETSEVMATPAVDEAK
ncbi:hypothetical protein HK101_011068 [Irineochytrium annulatum]|nr:hypothetical protein HK101_011068 [Irineochytrium annulatum]